MIFLMVELCMLISVQETQVAMLVFFLKNLLLPIQLYVLMAVLPLYLVLIVMSARQEVLICQTDVTQCEAKTEGLVRYPTTPAPATPVDQ
jgi:hypothetical protein